MSWSDPTCTLAVLASLFLAADSAWLRVLYLYALTHPLWTCNGVMLPVVSWPRCGVQPVVLFHRCAPPGNYVFPVYDRSAASVLPPVFRLFHAHRNGNSTFTRMNGSNGVFKRKLHKWFTDKG